MPIFGTTSPITYDVTAALARKTVNVHIDSLMEAMWIDIASERAAGYELVSVSEVHTAAATDGGAVTLDVKATPDDTTAPSGGRTLLSSTFNLKSTANTRVTKSAGAGLTATAADRTFATDERIALVPSGVLTGYAGGLVQLIFAPL